MSRQLTDITSVFDRRAAAVERQINLLRRDQQGISLAIQQLELACASLQRRMRELVLTGHGATTVLCLHEASMDGRNGERKLGNLRTRLSNLRNEEVQNRQRRKTCFEALAGLRRKADHLRQCEALRLRKKARRQFADEIGAPRPGAVE